MERCRTARPGSIPGSSLPSGDWRGATSPPPRRIGALAHALRLVQPSYQTVRVVLSEIRRHGLRPTTGEVLFQIAVRSRPPEALLRHLAGTLPPLPK